MTFCRTLPGFIGRLVVFDSQNGCQKLPVVVRMVVSLYEYEDHPAALVILIPVSLSEYWSNECI